MKKLAAFLLTSALMAAGINGSVSPSFAAVQALRPNVYFHFTDGHGSDFRVPQAVPGLAACDQVKLAAIAKAVQKSQPVYAGWTYVKAECKAPRR
jgi:hypothetical protein